MLASLKAVRNPFILLGVLAPSWGSSIQNTTERNLKQTDSSLMTQNNQKLSKQERWAFALLREEERLEGWNPKRTLPPGTKPACKRGLQGDQANTALRAKPCVPSAAWPWRGSIESVGPWGDPKHLQSGVSGEWKEQNKCTANSNPSPAWVMV